MIKFRLYFDKDKETAWLNAMAADGWAMTRFIAGFYWFDSCEKGKYAYQIDFGQGFFHINNDYREFMQDTDVEIVQTWGPWVILRKLTANGSFKLYTDVDSNIQYYTKIRKMFKAVLILEIICFFMELFAALYGSVHGAYAFCLLILAFMVVFANAIAKTTDTIIHLEERKGIVSSKNTRKTISLILSFGLLLNGCVFLLEEETALAQSAINGLRIVAIVFMLVGIYRTAKNIKQA